MTLRMLGPADDFEDLTRLLHRAYAALGEDGMNFTAVDQSVETTIDRCQEGECWVAEIGGAIVGTVVWSVGGDAHDPSYYRVEGVAHFGQFGVDPAYQGRGIGQALLAKVEERAGSAGYREMALDTAEPARRLVEFYERLGYRLVDRHQWRGKSYPSLILAKPLG